MTCATKFFSLCKFLFTSFYSRVTHVPVCQMCKLGRDMLSSTPQTRVVYDTCLICVLSCHSHPHWISGLALSSLSFPTLIFHFPLNFRHFLIRFSIYSHNMFSVSSDPLSPLFNNFPDFLTHFLPFPPQSINTHISSSPFFIPFTHFLPSSLTHNLHSLLNYPLSILFLSSFSSLQNTCII